MPKEGGKAVDKKALEREIEGILHRGKLVSRNPESRAFVPEAMQAGLAKFDRKLRSAGKSLYTITALLRQARDLGLWLAKERGRERFEEAEADDLEAYMASIYDRTSNSRRLARQALRSLYWVLEGSRKRGKRVVPEKAEVEPIKDDHDRLDPRKVPLYREAEKVIMAMIGAVDHPRDRGILALSFDSGARMGEVLNLRIGDVQLEREFGSIVLRGKTGGRTVRITRSVPYLRTWLAMHPDSGNPEARLWTAIGTDRPLSGSRFRGVIRRASERSGIPFTPHDLRHTRATECAQLGWAESKMRRFFGWSERSRTPSVYIHINMEDVDSQVMTDAGLEEAARPEPIWRPWTCARCATVNEAESPLCRECNLARDADVAEALAESREERGSLRARLAQLEERMKALDPDRALGTALDALEDEEPAEGRRGGEGEARGRPAKRTARARRRPKPIRHGEEE